MPDGIRRFCAVIAMIMLAWSGSVGSAFSQGPFLDNSPFPMMLRPQSGEYQAPRQKVVLPKKASTFEEIVPRVDYPTAFLQPLPLRGTRIPGLTAKSVEMLGGNFFVVVDNAKFNTMSAIYRDNRLKGKSNFVTADSIVHPYLAFSNRVIADVIVEHIAPDLTAMLKAMLDKSLSDYKEAEDADVRGDIEQNIAFLSVAVKLLDPRFFPPISLRVVPMVQSDLKSIYACRGAQSAIFKRPVDFSVFRPGGWYASSPVLSNFYRCKEWVTQMSYPFTDVDLGAGGGRVNYFRRSVLLYRSLESSTIDGKPGFDTWERLFKSWSLLGAQLKDWQENTISPLEYKAQLKSTSADLKVTLHSLAEPLFRTKLLLSIRRQKPLKLGATSILDLGDAQKDLSESQVRFRLLPLSGDPERPWLQSCLNLLNTMQESGSSCPFALAITHAWGAMQANNTMLDHFSRLDAPLLTKMIPVLDQSVAVKLPGGAVKPIDDRRWQILSHYFKPVREGVQPVIRTESWMTRMLESAFAGWVDSHLAIAPEPVSSCAEGQKPASAVAGQEPLSDNRPAPARMRLFHYLQPSPQLFESIAADARHTTENLTALGYLSPRHKERFADFIRLCERLQKIADLELKGQTLPLADVKLLQNIDIILDNVEVPTVGLFSLQTENQDPTVVGAVPAGVNFGLGRPGQLFIILQDGTSWTLGRGAMYTYFELAGQAVTPEHWLRKVDNDMLRPTFWAEKFDTVQEAVAMERKPKVAH